MLGTNPDLLLNTNIVMTDAILRNNCSIKIELNGIYIN